MPDFVYSTDFYLWVKSFHIIAVIAFMAGMLYLPRLFVYHSETTIGSPESERFKVMERKLLKAIINPSLIALWILGLTLSFLPATQAWDFGWFHMKFGLAIGLSAIHGFFSGSVKRMARDERRYSQRFWRIWNEVPALLMIAIVILVVVKPF